MSARRTPYGLEDDLTVSYGVTKQKVLELDPMDGVAGMLSNWEGYMFFENQDAGNTVTIEIYTECGGIENPEPEDVITLSGSVQRAVFTMMRSLKHNVYVQGSADGSLKIAYRVVQYT